MRVKRLTRCALLTAIALAIFVLEAQIPIPFPVPGMKLGLSNIITLFALFSFGWKDALAIVVIRILLGNLASGQVTALQDVVTAPAYTIDGVKLILTNHSSLTLYTVDGTMVAHGDYPAMSQITLEPSRCYILLLNGITYKVMTRE